MEHLGGRCCIKHRLQRINRRKVTGFHNKAVRLIHKTVHRRDKKCGHACAGYNG